MRTAKNKLVSLAIGGLIFSAGALATMHTLEERTITASKVEEAAQARHTKLIEIKYQLIHILYEKDSAANGLTESQYAYKLAGEYTGSASDDAYVSYLLEKLAE